MAGPYFLMSLSLRDGTARKNLARRIFKSGSKNDIGLIFGAELIRCLFRNIETFTNEFLTEYENSLVFAITSYPSENDVMELFDQQLNIWKGADPSKAVIVNFLWDVLSMDEIAKITAAIWDGMVPDYHHMPSYQMSSEEFIEWIKNYYRREMTHDRSGGAEGLFRVVVRKPAAPRL